jgi:hypothetical protein
VIRRNPERDPHSACVAGPKGLGIYAIWHNLDGQIGDK